MPEREKEICFRLREFRESTKIPRTTFALTIGISGERMASYEKYRVPVRYGVFKAINQHYHLRLDWLMNARGNPTSSRPFDDSPFASRIDPRERLSVVYDTILSKDHNPDREEAEAFFLGPGGLDAKLGELERIVANPKECRKLPKELLPCFVLLLEKALAETRKAIERDAPPEEKYRRAMRKSP